VWLQKSVRVHMNKPLDALFLKWAGKIDRSSCRSL